MLILKRLYKWTDHLLERDFAILWIDFIYVCTHPRYGIITLISIISAVSKLLCVIVFSSSFSFVLLNFECSFSNRTHREASKEC